MDPPPQAHSDVRVVDLLSGNALYDAELAHRVDARHLARLTRDTNKLPGAEVTFDQLTEPTPTQRKAFELLGIPISVRIV